MSIQIVNPLVQILDGGDGRKHLRISAELVGDTEQEEKNLRSVVDGSNLYDFELHTHAGSHSHFFVDCAVPSEEDLRKFSEAEESGRSSQEGSNGEAPHTEGAPSESESEHGDSTPAVTAGIDESHREPDPAAN